MYTAVFFVYIEHYHFGFLFILFSHFIYSFEVIFNVSFVAWILTK